jgi:hypothetical protein
MEESQSCLYFAERLLDRGDPYAGPSAQRLRFFTAPRPLTRVAS